MPNSVCRLYVVILLAEIEAGGQARAMCALGRALARSGHKVTTLSLEEMRTPEKFRGMDVRYIGTTRVTRAVIRVGRTLRELKPDLILTASLQVNLLGILCGRLWWPKAMIVVTEHAMPLWQLRFAPSLKLRVSKWTQQIFYRGADRIVAVSEPVARQLSEMLWLPCKRITTIHNIVLNAELRAGAARPPQHPWLAHKNGHVVIALGHLIEPKGYDVLIRAFGTVRRRSTARLIIFGEGNQRTILQELIAQLGLMDCVDLAGTTANPYAEIRAADLLVSAALVEAAPLTVCEAMCLGRPVVATDAEGGTAEMLGHGRYGRLVPVGQPDALAEAIITVLKRQGAGEVTAGGEQQFEESHIVARWMDMINEIRPIPGRDSCAL